MPWHTRVMLGGDGRDRGKLLEKDVLTFIIQLLWQSYKLITFCLMDLETRSLKYKKSPSALFLDNTQHQTSRMKILK